MAGKERTRAGCKRQISSMKGPQADSNTVKRARALAVSIPPGDEDLSLITMPIHQPKQKHDESSDIFPWEKLPAEMRNNIYDLLLTTDEMLSIDLGAGNALTIDTSIWNWKPATTILLLNKQTYTETASLLYRNNFIFSTPYVLHKFMSRLTPAAKLSLARIDLCDWKRPAHAKSSFTAHAFRSLRHAPSLTSLTLHGNGGRKGSQRSPPPLAVVAQQLLASTYFRKWMRAIGRASGDARAGADVVRLCPSCLTWWVPADVVRGGGAEALRQGIAERGREFREALGDLLEEDGGELLA